MVNYQLSHDEWRSCTLNLNYCKTRNDGYRLLANLSKHQLIMVCGELSIAVHGNDNKTSLTDKIVNATVGAKLNSEAIRGLQL